MPQVISASRRTDIPAFYAEWFIRRLSAGSVIVQQPYSGRYSAVSLAPGDVAAFVFWSKNYASLLSRLEQVERVSKSLFFHFTITGNRDLELAVPDPRDAIRDFLYLSHRYSSAQITWRFDPLCITDKLTYEIHEERFRLCAEQLQGAAERCIISFVHPYKKVLVNMAKQGDHRLADISPLQKRQYALRLAVWAEHFGIRLLSCCNDFLLCGSIGKAACIDGKYLSGLFGSDFDMRPASIRKECACTRSIDIGAYDTCAHGCLYCYANADKDRARAAVLRHDPAWNALNGNIPGEKISLPEEAGGAVFLKKGIDTGNMEEEQNI